MSTWRQKAIDCVPELKQDFEQPGVSIYDIFRELLPVTVEAHRKNNISRLKKIYAFAEWCFRQKTQDLWNAAAVGFYEHLGDYEVTWNNFAKWVKHDIYKETRVLLQLRIDNAELIKLDKYYSKSRI